MSAAFCGNKLKKTKRYQFGERIGRTTRHLLLMTATPHNGKEEDFQLFLSLLDSDRFYGKFRDGVHKVDVSDLMRRMVKEELLKFDGTPLFPERRAYTLNYRLSDAEAALYEAVTHYVREEMNRADNLDDKRRGTVGFALTILQRRLASWPEAIYQSLKRRRKRLERRLEETKLEARGGQLLDQSANDLPNVDWDSLDEAPDAEIEALEEQVVDQATAARTIPELQAEILSLKALEDRPGRSSTAARTANGTSFPELLQDDPEMRTPAGSRRKLIIFTEHKDTLNYLSTRIRSLLGQDQAVVIISRRHQARDRRKIQEASATIQSARYWSPPTPPAKASTCRTPTSWSTTTCPGTPTAWNSALGASTASARPRSATCGTWSPTRPARATSSSACSTSSRTSAKPSADASSTSSARSSTSARSRTC